MTWRKNERAVEDAGPYKGLGESAPVFGGASMRAAGDAGPYKGLGESAPVSGGAPMRAVGDAGPYGSESGAVSKFENISKRADTSTSRAGATRGGIADNIKTMKHRKNHRCAATEQRTTVRNAGAAAWIGV